MRTADQSPAVFDVVKTSEIEIVAAGLDIDDAMQAALLELLSGQERERADRYRNLSVRRNYIAARGQLRQQLAGRLHMSAAEIEIVTAPRGKPALGAGHGDCALRFNISHSGALAVFAFARGREVGVDVEELRKVPDVEGMAARYFSPREAADLMRLPEDRRDAAFLACWTRKEAFIKALGEGLHYPLKSFEVSIEPDRPAAILSVGDLSGDVAGWSMIGFIPAPGYVGAAVY